MKIYFNASLIGKEKYLKEYKAIINIIKQLRHKIFYEHIINRNWQEVEKLTRKQHEKDFQRTRNQIKNSDLMLIEATYPSIGGGRIMTIGLEMFKPTLVLYQESTNPHGLLIGDPNRLLTVKKYSLTNKKRLEQIIKNFLEKSKTKILKKRFNFLLSESQDEYLNFISQKENISKADFIRRLINVALEKNKNFTE